MDIKFHALQLTAYENNGFIDFKDYMKDIIQDQMYQTEFKELLEAYNQYCKENSYEDYLENNDELFETYFGTMIEAVRATQYGDYNYTHDYVQFNGYGNLDSYSKEQVEYEIQNDKSFINYIYDWIDEHKFIDIDELLEHKEDILKESYNLVRQGY